MLIINDFIPIMNQWNEIKELHKFKKINKINLNELRELTGGDIIFPRTIFQTSIANQINFHVGGEVVYDAISIYS